MNNEMRHVVWIGHTRFVEGLKRQIEWEGLTSTHHILVPEPWMLEHHGQRVNQGIFQKIQTALMDLILQDPQGLRALRETAVVVLLPEWRPASWTPGRLIVPSYEGERGSHYYTPAQVMDQLVLAFPEVRWIFLSHEKPLAFLSDLHTLTPHDLFSTFRTHVVPLFDASGLRSFLRRELFARHRFRIDWSRLHRLALAIDEEPSYAFFESYTAFRTAFRSIPITTEQNMHAFLGSDGFPIRADVVLEDLYINFPDRTIQDPLSILELRDQHFPRLRNPQYVRKRVLVTVGHRSHSGEEKVRKNQDYMMRLRSWGVDVIPVHKPLSGIHAFARLAGLNPPTPSLLEIASEEARRTGEKEQEDHGHSHSSPGVLLRIAHILLRRARAILDMQEELTVEDAVHGAVLALEAKELLGGRTPTSTLQALALQHELEVIAESRFYGIEAHIDVDQRVEELDREIGAIVRWFHPSRRELTHRNAMIQILTRLMRRLEEVNLVEESERTLHYIREQERKIWVVFRSSRSLRLMRFPLYHIVNGVWWYVNRLMISPARFLAVSLFWILFFGVLYGVFPGETLKGATTGGRFVRGVFESLFIFLNFSPMRSLWGNESLIVLLLTGVEGALGFLHFGVLVSYLYRLVARR